MPHLHAFEILLSACRVDTDDHEQLVACCHDHVIPEEKLQAVVDCFRSLSDAFEVFVTI